MREYICNGSGNSLNVRLILLLSICIGLATLSGGRVLEREVGCDTFRERRRCHKDHTPHCLTSGVVVLGSCKLLTAICVTNQVEDPSWESCGFPSEDDWYRSQGDKPH